MGDQRIDPEDADRNDPPTRGRSSAPRQDASNARWNDDGGFEPHATDGVPIPPAAVAPARATKGGLFLRGVLDSALPHQLGTDDEPERYTVAAVFSRRVSPEERALIEGPSTLAVLAERGYPEVGLKVADRRLEITRTNLTMLAGGLATEIAAVLRDVEQQVVAARARRAEEVLRWSTAESARAARVKAEADRVRFE
ncbi:hypothetical protein [Myceligenerans salitolerans]|uniref:Uncharacterized protein n=1 Tax=Myceligenerans salitolerans TaxID=1230528 RepID=A0ABS3I771_9MICO|nr:hypothetical protein [Myceligenerans salitolerans]MBO0608338.1 hypothetical protein [Myceligenerans salitolerans]